MPFKQGTSGNPAGRPKGSPNKATDQLRALIADVISDNWQTFIKDIKQLDPEKRVMLMDRLIKHVLPPPLDPIQALTPEQIDQVINELQKRYGNKE